MRIVNLLLLLSAFAFHLSPAAVPQEKPEVIKKVTPAYPRVYLLAGIEGEVYVHATIDESGKVVNVDIVKATDKGFGPAAMDAIKQWEFKPATLDGKPITTEVTIPVKFKLGDANLPPGELVTLREEINGFLEKGRTAGLLSGIDSSAYVVAGARYEPLLSLLKDKTLSSLLARGNQQILSAQLKTDGRSDAAYMIVRTKAGKSERFHTIVMMKDESERWKIVSWHVSP